jgi:hypothetical protein
MGRSDPRVEWAQGKLDCCCEPKNGEGSHGGHGGHGGVLSIGGSIHVTIHGLKAVLGDLAGDVEWPPDATDRSTKPSVSFVSSVRAFPILDSQQQSTLR